MLILFGGRVGFHPNLFPFLVTVPLSPPFVLLGKSPILFHHLLFCEPAALR